MTMRVWSSEERRAALVKVSQLISERVQKANMQRSDVSVEACEEHQAMQVAIELQCRLTEVEAIADRALDRANKYMDLCGIGTAPEGIKVIALERLRQIVEEGWTPEHDDKHFRFEMAAAARSYAWAAELVVICTCKGSEVAIPNSWPWDREWWRPSDDPIRNLAKAGALIAAEIDRLYRAGGVSQ